MTCRLTILVLFISLKLLGQDQIELKGYVTSKEGKPQDDVEILVIDSDKKTRVDSCGRFKILIPKNKDSYVMISHDVYTFHSEKLLPFYFNLKKIKDKNLNKTIVLKTYYSDSGKKDKACPTDTQEKVIIKLTRTDKKVPR